MRALHSFIAITAITVAAVSAPACSGSSDSKPATTPTEPGGPTATGTTDAATSVKLIFDPAAGVTAAELTAAVDIVKARLAAMGQGTAAVSVEGNTLVVVLDPAAVDAASDVIRAVITRGALSMHAVDSGSAAMKAVYTDLSKRGAGPVTGEIDTWRTHKGKEVTDYYVQGPTRDAVAAVFAGVEVENRIVGLERITAGGAEAWRSFWLVTPPIIDNSGIGSVKAVTPATGLSGVMIDLTPEASKAFADATEKNLGKKIAIVLDGQVRLAPVVMQKIVGGQLSLTTPGDAKTSAADAKRLAATLESGVLPELTFRKP